jgi:hypothetical protein
LISPDLDDSRHVRLDNDGRHVGRSALIVITKSLVDVTITLHSTLMTMVVLLIVIEMTTTGSAVHNISMTIADITGSKFSILRALTVIITGRMLCVLLSDSLTIGRVSAGVVR